MDYNLYYSTVGLFLDIMVLSSLAFANLGEHKFLNKCKLYVPMFITFKMLEYLKYESTIFFYIILYVVMVLLAKVLFKFKTWNFFIFITNFILFALLDTFVYFNFTGISLLIISTLYKLVLIYINQNFKIPNLENKNILVNKMLTNVSISILIVIALFAKEVI